jgi:hypothetical protein
MQKQKRFTWAALAAVLLATGISMPSAHAQSADALLDKLVDKGVLSVKEAQELREQSDDGFHKAFQAKTGMPDWVNQLKISGDLRGRWDFIKTDNDAPGAAEPNKDRSRFRYRLRVGAVAQMKDGFEVGLRLTSAEQNSFGGDPISGNASYQDNGSKKFIYIDQAYGKWTPLNSGPWLLSGTVGKMENPFTYSDMVFDPDYTPEGFAIQAGYAINGAHSLKLNGGVFILDEINQGSQASDDPYLIGIQLRHDAKWSPKLASTVGVGWMNLVHEQNLNNAAVPNINVGNTRYPALTGSHLSGDLVAEFRPIVVDASVTYTLDKIPLYAGAFPIRVGGEYMHNPGADEENTGYWLGVFFGKSGKKNTWELSYRYKHLEADAWYEEFVDSDTGAYRQAALSGSGAGSGYRPGSGLQGHVVKFAYSLSDAFTVGVTYYLYELIDPPIVATKETESSAHRVQLDATWKF